MDDIEVDNGDVDDQGLDDEGLIKRRRRRCYGAPPKTSSGSVENVSRLVVELNIMCHGVFARRGAAG